MSKILVVEDEKNLRLLYRMDLEREGHVVVTAAHGAEGLRLFESESPDLVVLDIRMPGMDGLDAMGRMLGRNPWIPVVLNSGYSSHMDSFMSWAADAYVVKSSDTGELRAKIREILDARAQLTRRSGVELESAARNGDRSSRSAVRLESTYEIDGRPDAA